MHTFLARRFCYVVSVKPYSGIISVVSSAMQQQEQQARFLLLYKFP